MYYMMEAITVVVPARLLGPEVLQDVLDFPRRPLSQHLYTMLGLEEFV